MLAYTRDIQLFWVPHAKINKFWYVIYSWIFKIFQKYARNFLKYFSLDPIILKSFIKLFPNHKNGPCFFRTLIGILRSELSGSLHWPKRGNPFFLHAPCSYDVLWFFKVENSKTTSQVTLVWCFLLSEIRNYSSRTISILKLSTRYYKMCFSIQKWIYMFMNV